MKVFQIAKELGVTSKEVLAKLHEMGVEAKNQVAMVDDIMLAVLRGEAPPPPKPDPAAKAAAAKAAAAKVDAKGAKGAKPAKAPAKPAPAAAPAVAAPAATPAAPTASPKSKAKAKAKAKESPAEPAAAPTPTPELDTVSGSLPLAEVVDGNVLRLRGPIIVKNLAEVLSLKPNIIIAELMKMNILAAINQSIDVQIIRKIAEKHGFTVQIEKRGRRPSIESKLEERPEDEDQPEDLMPRPPVVTFLGHVDHGKTSLLDQIRNAKVAAGESGGITQHIGAYTVELSGKKIAFLDTPGHAAFTAMRARGANLTDVAVIIIAADDGIMPQTREAIKHVQAAGVAMMVAINKIDMPTADVQRVLQQLQAEGLAPEEWGGDLICCPVSAETGDGIDHLLEMILLQADVLELKANPTRRAEGYVIEAQLEPGMGPTANMLIKRGTLSVGDVILCGQYSGKVRALINDHGAKVKSAGPSTPIKCLGLPGVPGAGDRFQVFANDKAARTLASEEATKLRHESLYTPVKTSLDSLFTEMAEGEKMELKVVLKADTQGSVEAIATSLEDMLRARWGDWLTSVEEGWHTLSGYCDQTVILGLSMGGVLSLLFSTLKPVTGVVAMSTPYALPPDPRLRFLHWLHWIQPIAPHAEESDWVDSEAEAVHTSYGAYPSRSIIEFRDLLAEMRAALPAVKAPVLLMHSRSDGGVSPESMPKIYAELGTEDKEMLWLENSGHVITRDAARQQVFTAAEAFIRRVTAK